MTLFKLFLSLPTPLSSLPWYWASIFKHISSNNNKSFTPILPWLKTEVTTLFGSNPLLFSFLKTIIEGEKPKSFQQQFYSCVDV